MIAYICQSYSNEIFKYSLFFLLIFLELTEEANQMADLMVEHYSSSQTYGEFIQKLEGELDDEQSIKLIIVDAPFLRKPQGTSYVLNPDIFALNHLCNSSTVLVIACPSHPDVSLFLFLFL